MQIRDYLYLIWCGVVGGVILVICCLAILGLQDVLFLR